MRLPCKFLLLLVLLAASITNAWSADGRILSFEGDVRVNGQPVTDKTLLNNKDTIATAAGASVKIVLSDNSVLDVESDSTIRLSDYNYNAAAPEENKSDVSVVEGTLRYVSGMIAKEDPDNIRFTAGNSTIGVRGSFTEIEVEGVVVNVEAMIGEATLTKEKEGGTAEVVVVPTGQATQSDPATGATLLTPSTTSNAVNTVVHAIAALSPNASNASAKDEGCSEGPRPMRLVARPEKDPEAAAAIAEQLAGLSKGDLMMVMAVLINNAGHLCIDSSTVADTVAIIATVRPEVAVDIVFVAVLLDPGHADQITGAAQTAAPDQAANIQESGEIAEAISGRPTPPRRPTVNVNPANIEQEVPPGGAVGEPPSPE